VEDDNVVKTDTVNIEAIEDIEDIEAPHLHSVSGQPNNSNISLSVSKIDKKVPLFDVKTSIEGETDRIAELAEKASSTLDPITVDQTLLQSLRQKYQ